MKVKFYVDSGANIHSCKEEIIDTNEYGYDDWESMTDDEKQEAAQEWAVNNGFCLGYEELG